VKTDETITVKTLPALFLGHGSPMNAIEHNEFHQAWGELGRRLPRPKAVLCVSAHWETRGVCVTAAESPETIHDFGGFPQELFDVRYPASGDPALAHRVANLLADDRATLDPKRGLDHGAWGVLIAMYPNADVPIVQLSMEASKPGSFHFALAKKLRPLRDEGVLIVGSGNIVHNLRLLRWDDPTPPDWATRFDADLKRLIVERNDEALMNHDSIGPHAKLAVPTNEHFFPLLYVIAQRDPGERVAFFNEQVVSTISMTSVMVADR
jgi:4,5-DOPA dioxygenase extradiol